MHDQPCEEINLARVNGVGPLWQAYTVDTTNEQARAAFVQKRGYEPETIRRTLVLVLAGPIITEAK